MRTALVAVAILLLGACGGGDANAGPDPAELTSQLRRALAQRAVAIWLLDRGFAKAERVDFADTIVVAVLQRRETGDPDLLSLRLRVSGKALVVHPPRLPEGALRQFDRPGVTAAEIERGLAPARAAAAKAQPEAARSETVEVLKQVTVQVRRIDGSWTMVLPVDLAGDGRAAP